MLGFFAIALMTGVPAADAAIGEWKSPTKNAIVKIAPCGTSICGQLISSDDINANPNRKDVKNKKPELRNRPLKGVAMLGGFTKNKNEWQNGWVYNGSDGNTYSGKITIVDQNHIKLKGCVIAPLCKTETWTRVK